MAQFDYRAMLAPYANQIGYAGEDLGASLASSPTIWTALGAATKRSAEKAPERAVIDMQRKQQAADLAEKNQTSEWIKANFPQYSNLPAAQAWQAAMGDLAAQRNAANGGSRATGFAPVAGTIDGKPAYIQFDNAGGMTQIQTPEGFTPQSRYEKVDLGNEWLVTDTTTGQAQRYPKSGDVPTGYEQAPSGGGIAPMPGGPQATEVNAARVNAGRALNTLETKNKIAVGAIDKALSQASWATTGMLGGATAGLGGTPAYDLARTLDTIKANIGFDELQTMRDNSPTGGALGQVTERELAFLQSTIASIEQAQSEDQLRANLKILRDYLSMSAQQRKQAFDMQFGGDQQPAGQSTSTGVTWSYEP